MTYILFGKVFEALLSEDVGVAAEHLLIDAPDDILHGEEAFFLRNLCVHDDLKEQVAELFLQAVGLSGLCQDVDPAHDLCSFLNTGGLEGQMILCPVPGAAVRRPETGYGLLQFLHGLSGPLIFSGSLSRSLFGMLFDGGFGCLSDSMFRLLCGTGTGSLFDCLFDRLLDYTLACFF